MKTYDSTKITDEDEKIPINTDQKTSKEGQKYKWQTIIYQQKEVYRIILKAINYILTKEKSGYFNMIEFQYPGRQANTTEYEKRKYIKNIIKEFRLEFVTVLDRERLKLNNDLSEKQRNKEKTENKEEDEQLIKIINIKLKLLDKYQKVFIYAFLEAEKDNDLIDLRQLIKFKLDDLLVDLKSDKDNYEKSKNNGFQITYKTSDNALKNITNLNRTFKLESDFHVTAFKDFEKKYKKLYKKLLENLPTYSQEDFITNNIKTNYKKLEEFYKILEKKGSELLKLPSEDKFTVFLEVQKNKAQNEKSNSKGKNEGPREAVPTGEAGGAGETGQAGGTEKAESKTDETEKKNNAEKEERTLDYFNAYCDYLKESMTNSTQLEEGETIITQKDLGTFENREDYTDKGAIKALPLQLENIFKLCKEIKERNIKKGNPSLPDNDESDKKYIEDIELELKNKRKVLVFFINNILVKNLREYLIFNNKETNEIIDSISRELSKILDFKKYKSEIEKLDKDKDYRRNIAKIGDDKYINNKIFDEIKLTVKENESDRKLTQGKNYVTIIKKVEWGTKGTLYKLMDDKLILKGIYDYYNLLMKAEYEMERGIIPRDDKYEEMKFGPSMFMYVVLGFLTTAVGFEFLNYNKLKQASMGL